MPSLPVDTVDTDSVCSIPCLNNITLENKIENMLCGILTIRLTSTNLTDVKAIK